MSEAMTETKETRLESYLESNEQNQYLTFSVREERFAFFSPSCFPPQLLSYALINGRNRFRLSRYGNYHG